MKKSIFALASLLTMSIAFAGSAHAGYYDYPNYNTYSYPSQGYYNYGYSYPYSNGYSYPSTTSNYPYGTSSYGYYPYDSSYYGSYPYYGSNYDYSNGWYNNDFGNNYNLYYNNGWDYNYDPINYGWDNYNSNNNYNYGWDNNGPVYLWNNNQNPTMRLNNYDGYFNNNGLYNYFPYIYQTRPQYIVIKKIEIIDRDQITKNIVFDNCVSNPNINQARIVVSHESFKKIQEIILQNNPNMNMSFNPNNSIYFDYPGGNFTDNNSAIYLGGY